MSLYKQDGTLHRELTHAHDRSTDLRSRNRLAEVVITQGKKAADNLYLCAIRHRTEQADDDPARARRDEAAAALYEGCLGIVRHFEAKITIECTDQLGKVTNKERLARARSVIDKFLPAGRPSAVATAGPQLQVNGQVLRDGVASFPGMHKLAAQLDPLLVGHAAGMAEVRKEDEELSATQKQLDDARTEAVRLRRAGQAYVEFLAIWEPELGIDPSRIYPRTSRRAPEASEEPETPTPIEEDTIVEPAPVPTAPTPTTPASPSVTT
jgi:hypothetical protein